MKYINRLVIILLFLSLALFVGSYFYKGFLIENKKISDASLSDPVQTELSDKSDIKLSYDGYDYVVKPLFNYKITGVVVNKMDYDPPVEGGRKVIRFDLCLVWGDNISSKVYASPGISFSQNGRFCTVSWGGETKFSMRSLSNNHLFITDDKIIEKLKTINRSDEVSINGKLANINAKQNGVDIYNISSSTNRDDTGAGACEIIYVESIDILSSAHENTMRTNYYSLIVLSFFGAILLLRFILFVLFSKPKLS